MNKKDIIRKIIFVIAIAVGVVSWLYSNNLAKKLAEEEEKNVSLWVDAVREIDNTDFDGEISLLAYKIIQGNTNIPIILYQENNTISTANIDGDVKDEAFLDNLSKKMHEMRPPLMIGAELGKQDILYYDDSKILKQLETYPIIQFAVMVIFIVVCFIALRNSTKAEENMMMVGMSKETAHQLGTPISSLLAWVEILKADNSQPELTQEVEKDVNRLVKITDRFSRIGSTPELKAVEIGPILANSIKYLQSRTPKVVEYTVTIPNDKAIIVPLNVSLFEWVIENLCKNAVDAMEGRGKLSIKLYDDEKKACIEISDTGKGIPKRNFKTVFKAGFTTKKHGWGLGLSLAARIVNYYHNGKIFVKNSEIGKGTTFKIVFPKLNH